MEPEDSIVPKSHCKGQENLPQLSGGGDSDTPTLDSGRVCTMQVCVARILPSEFWTPSAETGQDLPAGKEALQANDFQPAILTDLNNAYMLVSSRFDLRGLAGILSEQYSRCKFRPCQIAARTADIAKAATGAAVCDFQPCCLRSE